MAIDPSANISRATQAYDQAQRRDHQCPGVAATGGQSWGEESRQHGHKLTDTGD